MGLTIEGLLLGFLAGVLLPPVLTAALRRRLGRGVALAAASIAGAVLIAFVLGFVQDHPSAAIGAGIFAPGVQMWATAVLWRDRLPVMLGLMGLGALWLVPALRFIGVW